MEAPRPDNEAERLRCLHSYGLLDTPPEPRFDRIVRLASELLDCPIALVSLVDESRQWFKARVGLDAEETPRELAFCAHAIVGDNPVMVVRDASADVRFANNPLVLEDPKIRFYAGAPLVADGEFSLGTLCVIDRQPREFDKAQLDALRDLAAITIDAIDQHRRILALQHARARTLEANEELRALGYAIGHDLAAPMRQLAVFSSLFAEQHGAGLAEEAHRDLDRITSLAAKGRRMTSELSKVAVLESSDDIERGGVELESVLGDVETTLEAGGPLERNLDVKVVRAHALYLRQIFANLVGNAFKYGARTVRIDSSRTADGVEVGVLDDGPGIPDARKQTVFRAFYRLEPKKTEGTGLGLTLVRRLVQLHGGHIRVEDSPLGGAAFRFTISQA